MGIKKYNPTTPSRRYITGTDFSEITKDKPERSLTRPLKKSGGRNAYGRITTRHIGGGHKRAYRVISQTSNEGGELGRGDRSREGSEVARTMEFRSVQ